ncbi:MAG: HAD-IA family hydrolase [Prolixibacteraceae bacterium]|nr:HAD-IA family hydrolase [Prolixibacteraceae bacterium]
MTKIKINPEVKALIFDLDGTLSNSLPIHFFTWERICQEYNCHFSEKIIIELTGKPTIIFARRIIEENHLTGITAEELVKKKQQLLWDNIGLLKPHPDVVSLVYENYGKRPMAVGTGACSKSAKIQLEALHITKYFDVVVSADDVTRHKPDPETFLKCAKLLGAKPSNCQVFEDGVLGMEAARKAGMFLTDVRPYTYKKQLQTIK